MSNNLNIIDGLDVLQKVKTTEISAGVHVPHHAIDSFPSYSLDGFSRLRVSMPAHRFDSDFVYDPDSSLWDQYSLNATITHNTTAKQMELATTVSATLSGSAIMQSHAYIPYTVGRSGVIFVAFSFSTVPTTGGFQRVGYFDGQNGIYLEQDSNGVRLKLISTTGNPPMIREQENWVDPLDGTGPSGKTLDLSKTQTMAIQIQPYCGSVGVGFWIEGEIVGVVRFANENVSSFPFWGNASLPVRFEVGSTAATTTQTKINAIWTSVASEGGQNYKDMPGRTFAASTGAVTIPVTTRRPILAIRSKVLLNGIQNNIIVGLETIDFFAEGNSAFVEIVGNPTTTTGGTWTNFDPQSSVESNTGITALTGGRVISSFYVSAGNKTASSNLFDEFGRAFMTYSQLLNAADVVCVVVTSIAATADVACSIKWKEIG
jgi:hypothetical protein